MIKVVKSLDSEITVTLDSQDLSKHLMILMFSFSLSKILPRLMSWFTMWVNLFCTSKMVSLLSILNISYSCIRACILALCTSMVLSWVTSRMSHISFVVADCKTLKNSSEFRAEVMMFLSIQHIGLFYFHSQSIGTKVSQ